MKILYVGKFGLPHNTENYVTHALTAVGCEVHRLPVSNTANDFAMNLSKHKPNFVLFSKPEPGGSRRNSWGEAAVTLCRKLGFPTVCWQWDLWHGYRGGGNLPAHFHADLLLTTDGGHDDAFALGGYNHQVLRQGIHRPEAFEAPRDYRWDVGFVGTHRGHGSRRALVAWLQRTYGERFTWIKNTRGTALNETLGQIKIIVGDSYPARDYWSNRIYEITGRGGFLLHPETAGLLAEYADCEHYASYRRNDFAGLKATIEHYLADDEERETIRRCGHEHTRDNYTYEHRVKELLTLIPAPR